MDEWKEHIEFSQISDEFSHRDSSQTTGTPSSQIRPKVAHGQIEWWGRHPDYLINFYNIYIDQRGQFTKLNIKKKRKINNVLIKGANKSQLN